LEKETRLNKKAVFSNLQDFFENNQSVNLPGIPDKANFSNMIAAGIGKSPSTNRANERKATIH
jgi:hypothetical protein